MTGNITVAHRVFVATVKKRWFCVEVSYETQGGEWKSARSEPIAGESEALREAARYRATGYRTKIIEVPQPDTKPSGRKARIGSHG